MKIETKAKGFTLIELMIVIAIIGILASIAIPQFAAFRTKAFNAAAASDVKNGNTTVEAIYSDVFDYPTAAAAVTSGAFTGGKWTTAWTASKDVTIGQQGTVATYGLAAKHKAGDEVHTKTRLLAFATTALSSGTAMQTAQIPTAD